MGYKDYIGMSLGWLALFTNKGPTNLCNPEFYYIVEFVVISNGTNKLQSRSGIRFFDHYLQLQ